MTILLLLRTVLFTPHTHTYLVHNKCNPPGDVCGTVVAGGDNPGPGRPENNCPQSMPSRRSHQGFSGHRGGSTESSPRFAVRSRDTVLRPRTSKKSKRYQGVVEAADCFMARWHRNEAQRNQLRQGAEDTPRALAKGGGGSRTDTHITAVDECRNEMINRVARYRFD